MPGLRDVGTVQVEHVLRLLGKIQQIGHGGLHAERHLVLRDARLDLGIAELIEVHPVQLARDVQHVAARLLVHSLRDR